MSSNSNNLLKISNDISEQRAVWRERAVLLRAKRKKENRCSWCGKPNDTNKSCCQACVEKGRAKQRRAAEDRKAKGLCHKCGKSPSIFSTQGKGCLACEVCYLKQTAYDTLKDRTRWTELKEVFDRQNVCPFTQTRLMLGYNTTLDHIVPRSRGGTHDTSNLQWVYKDDYFDINHMKCNMLDEEFRTLCARVAASCGGSH